MISTTDLLSVDKQAMSMNVQYCLSFAPKMPGFDGTARNVSSSRTESGVLTTHHQRKNKQSSFSHNSCSRIDKKPKLEIRKRKKKGKEKHETYS